MDQEKRIKSSKEQRMMQRPSDGREEKMPAWLVWWLALGDRSAGHQVLARIRGTDPDGPLSHSEGPEKATRAGAPDIRRPLF